jgi:hypothetical protein
MREPDDQRAPGEPSPAARIDVDLTGLDDVGGFLSRELEQHLRPMALEIAREQGGDHGFGHRITGGRIVAARHRYQESLAAATANLEAYVEASEIMIEAIKLVATGYRDSDARSAAGPTHAESQLATALRSAWQRQVSSAAAAEAHAQESRVRRIQQAIDA